GGGIGDPGYRGGAGGHGGSGGDGQGGAIYNDGGTVIAVNSSFKANMAIGGDGGASIGGMGGCAKTSFGRRVGDIRCGGRAIGAVREHDARSAHVQASTNSRYAAPAPAGKGGQGGSAGSPGYPGGGLGGAIYNYGGSVSLYGTSLYSNQAKGGTSYSRGGDGGSGGYGASGANAACSATDPATGECTSWSSAPTAGLNGSSGGRAGHASAQSGGDAQGGALFSFSGTVTLSGARVFLNTARGGNGSDGYGGTGGSGGDGGPPGCYHHHDGKPFSCAASGFGGDGGDGGDGASVLPGGFATGGGVYLYSGKLITRSAQLDKNRSAGGFGATAHYGPGGQGGFPSGVQGGSGALPLPGPTGRGAFPNLFRKASVTVVQPSIKVKGVRKHGFRPSGITSTISPIPVFSGSFASGGKTYPYTMVGTDPAKGSKTTTVPVEIVPVTTDFQGAAHAAPPTSPLTDSPIFQKAGFGADTTQYLDAMRRAEFWTVLKNGASAYHLALGKPTVTPAVTFEVPAGVGVQDPTGVSSTAFGDQPSFDGALRQVVKDLSPPAGTLVLFVGNDVSLFNAGACCNLGDHGWAAPGGSAFLFASILSTGPLAGVGGVSGQLVDWADNPSGGNAAPTWVQPIVNTLPQFVPAPPPVCFSSIMPAEATAALPTPSFTVKLGKNSYKLADPAGLSWFARANPSTEAGGAYDYAGHLTKLPGTVCTASNVPPP
ncbi:MAG: hypothetical protein ACHQ5A_10900, partial [Opitutales bacterium]